MTSRISAASRTVAVIGPAWSRNHESGAIPVRLTTPYVGLHPTQPQKLAGIRMLPPVSVPMVPAARRATMAAPEPPLDPPGMRPSSHGLTVTPYAFGFDVVTPYASSWVASLPSSTVPASRRDRATAA